MTPDSLDTISDAELNECFAVEVAGFDEPLVKTVFKNPELVHLRADMNFSTDANAVLPWLEKEDDAETYHNEYGWQVDLIRASAQAPTFARAACIALIRAKRAAAP